MVNGQIWLSCPTRVKHVKNCGRRELGYVCGRREERYEKEKFHPECILGPLFIAKMAQKFSTLFYSAISMLHSHIVTLDSFDGGINQECGRWELTP